MKDGRGDMRIHMGENRSVVSCLLNNWLVTRSYTIISTFLVLKPFRRM